MTDSGLPRPRSASARALDSSARLLETLRSPTVLQAVWWFAIVFVVTCLCKALYLRQVYGTGFGYMRTQLGGGQKARALVALHVFAVDVLEVALLAGLTVGLAHLLPRVVVTVVPGLVLAILFLALSANHLSLQQIGTFASFDTVITSLVFAARHREMWSSYITPLTGVGALVIVGCAAAPARVSRAADSA